MTVDNRAVQIWVLLACAAHERTIYTYGGLARKLGIDEAAGVISNYVGRIFYYCERHKLPQLTVLVVNQHTGIPGEELTKRFTPGKLNSERNRVFKHDWLGMPPPSVAALEEACS